MMIPLREDGPGRGRLKIAEGRTPEQAVARQAPVLFQK
jgi:hypothetical protein